MAAGLGFKTFTTGEVLTAGDVNGYLMQGINVFTNSTARDAAITAPAEGQFAFTKDNNSLWYYDGAAWVASGATGDIEGVTAGVGISGGGTSGTVTITNSMATAIDAKGDLVAGTGADTFSRLAVGANGTVLTADSAEATGMKWASSTAAAKSYTLINSGGTALTGATTVTVSGISGYNDLFIKIVGASTVANGSSFLVRFNSDSSNNYQEVSWSWNQGTYTMFGGSSTGTSGIGIAYTDTAADTFTANLEVRGISGSGIKPYNIQSYGSGTGTTERLRLGSYVGTSAITSVSVINDTGNLDAGTIYIYGA